jgi:hypothetical protein
MGRVSGPCSWVATDRIPEHLTYACKIHVYTNGYNSCSDSRMVEKAGYKTVDTFADKSNYRHHLSSPQHAIVAPSGLDPTPSASRESDYPMYQSIPFPSSSSSLRKSSKCLCSHSIVAVNSTAFHCISTAYFSPANTTIACRRSSSRSTATWGPRPKP